MFGFEELNAAYLQDFIYIAAILNFVFIINPRFLIDALNGNRCYFPNISFRNKWNALNISTFYIKNCCV